MDGCKFDRGDEHGPKRVEKDLKRGKECFTQDVRKQHGLHVSRQIGVVDFIAEEFVVQLVIRLE